MPKPLLFSGTSHPRLAQEVADQLGLELGKASTGKHNDGETRVEIHHSVRGRDVFVLQSTCPPVNDHLMELLLLVDALRRASTRSVTAVIPYFGYGRQERTSALRAPVSARLVADLLTCAGVHRVVTVELHSPAVTGFFNIPLEHVGCNSLFLSHVQHQDFGHPLCVVSPDAGGVERARSLAKLLNCSLTVIDKRREAPGIASVGHLVGHVEGCHGVIIDDLVDTGNTLIRAAEALLMAGATSVSALVTHGVFSKDAASKIQASRLTQLTITDTIPQDPATLAHEKIRTIGVAPLLAGSLSVILRDELQ